LLANGGRGLAQVPQHIFSGDATGVHCKPDGRPEKDQMIAVPIHPSGIQPDGIKAGDHFI